MIITAEGRFLFLFGSKVINLFTKAYNNAKMYR